MAQTFLEEIGGDAIIEKVHTILYDKLLSDPWLKHFFVGMERWHLEEQQTHFMSDLFGGSGSYHGRLPMNAHQHLFITEEVFMIRHRMLKETLTQVRIPEDQKGRWLQFDLGMKRALVKETIDDCEGRYRTEKVIAPPKPPGYVSQT